MSCWLIGGKEQEIHSAWVTAGLSLGGEKVEKPGEPIFFSGSSGFFSAAFPRKEKPIADDPNRRETQPKLLGFGVPTGTNGA